MRQTSRIADQLAWAIARKAKLATLIESVVEGAMSSDLLMQILNDLRGKRQLAQTAHERIAIDGAIADVLDGVMASGAVPHVLLAATPPVDASSIRVSAERPMSKHSQFYGLGLREACPKLLALVKQPQLPREIWEALKADGFTTAHSKPVHAVNDALRRRAKTHGDVLLVGEGKWGRTEWYTEAELEDIKKSVGGMGGRDKAAHSERTKAGMITAMSRGVKMGATRLLSPDDAKLALEMVRNGATLAATGKHFGVSPGTIKNCLKAQGYTLRELRKEKKAAENGLEPAATVAENETGETRH